MNVLAIDVGGTNIKLLATGHQARRKIPSGPKLTAKQMVDEVRKVAGDWKYDVVSIGYPGVVLDNRILSEPHNLGKGWAGFNFERAFGCPVRIINDAAMQALGSYKGGRMLFLGLGTGLGSAMIIDGQLQPMELAHLPYRKGTYEDYVGLRGMRDFGKKKWRRYVADVVKKLAAALEPDDVVLGGGNVRFLKSLPPKCRAGSNANAFIGAYRLWSDTHETPAHPAPPHPASTGTNRPTPKKRVNGKGARA
jgi:polyphosphate glucokinase